MIFNCYLYKKKKKFIPINILFSTSIGYDLKLTYLILCLGVHKIIDWVDHTLMNWNYVVNFFFNVFESI